MKNYLNRDFAYFGRLIMLISFVCLFVVGCKKKDIDGPEKQGGESFVSTYYPFPGTVLSEVKEPLHAYTAQSPSILVVSNGDYLASVFYDGGTNIYKSRDKGISWESISRVAPSNFATLFEHSGAVYLMGIAKGGRADVAIYKSMDQGRTWTSPTDSNSGILLKGMFHTAPVPVVKHDGKIWRAYEEIFGSADSRDFFAFAMYADEGSDLLKASSWKRTNGIRFDESWINARRPNWLEGNMVVSPEGKLINFMRLETWSGSGVQYAISGAAAGKPRNEIAALIDINAETMSAEFKNEARNFVHFPGAETKFTIRFDPVSKKYWTITNKISSFRNTTGTHDGNWHQRNLLVLMSSSDLKDWKTEQKVLRWKEGEHLYTWDTFGFQYIDWQFDGDDIVFLSRTSWYGQRYHDANMITFHRVAGFRTPTTEEPEDLVKYTQHPKLLDIPASILNNAISNIQEFKVQTDIGEGLVVDDKGKITLKNQLISNDEIQAIKAYRFIDFKITHPKGKDFSLETLDFNSNSNSSSFRLKWLYSIDGATFYPITSYLQHVENNIVGVQFSPSLYLPLYRELNRINGQKGVVLRCAVVRGNGTNVYMRFNDVIAVGGRVF